MNCAPKMPARSELPQDVACSLASCHLKLPTRKGGNGWKPVLKRRGSLRDRGATPRGKQAHGSSPSPFPGVALARPGPPKRLSKLARTATRVRQLRPGRRGPERARGPGLLPSLAAALALRPTAELGAGVGRFRPPPAAPPRRAPSGRGTAAPGAAPPPAGGFSVPRPVPPG